MKFGVFTFLAILGNANKRTLRLLVRATMMNQRKKEIEQNVQGRATRKEIRDAIQSLDKHITSSQDLLDVLGLELGAPSNDQIPQITNYWPLDDAEAEPLDILAPALGNAIAAFAPDGIDGAIPMAFVEDLANKLQRRRKNQLEAKGVTYDPTNSVYRGPLGLPCNPQKNGSSKSRFCLDEAEEPDLRQPRSQWRKKEPR